MVPGFGISAECQCIGTISKKQRVVARNRGLVFKPKKLSVGAYFELSFLGCGFLIHLSNRSDSPRFRVPLKKIRQKIWDTTRTVFIQGPSKLLLVWRSIMFNGSFLIVCRKLQFVKKIRFCLIESGRTKPWCPGLVSRPSAKAQEPVARSRGLVIQPPKLSVGAYFDLSFLVCGFLIHLSNMSDSPRL